MGCRQCHESASSDIWLYVRPTNRLLSFYYNLDRDGFFQGKKQLPTTQLSKILIIITVWVTITFIFGLYPEVAYPQWVKVMKILFMTFVGMMLLNTKHHLHCLMWAIVFSLAFYGIKGGVFTLLTGGSYRVYGPLTVMLQTTMQYPSLS